ncbi:MAG TPA: HU family DNA-binding protein [Planctomycetota bacterium]|jgi:nucleoid DNA-binding protein
MTKYDIAIQIAKETGVEQTLVKQVVQLTLDGIIDVLVSEGRLELRNFGVFEVRQREPRKGRNPRTGAEVQVPPRRVVRFFAGKEMSAKTGGPGEGPVIVTAVCEQRTGR